MIFLILAAFIAAALLALAYTGQQVELAQAQAELEQWRAMGTFAKASATNAATLQVIILAVALIALLTVCAWLYIQLRRSQAEPRRTVVIKPRAQPEQVDAPEVRQLPAGDPITQMTQLMTLQILSNMQRDFAKNSQIDRE